LPLNPDVHAKRNQERNAMSRFNVKKVAVLGAGVMGAQIAAHLVNVKVPVVLFDLPAKEGPKNGIVTKAIEGLKKLKPSPLGVPTMPLIQDRPTTKSTWSC
jgi:phosphoglycerate dehydrogenase-like enzyme